MAILFLDTVLACCGSDAAKWRLVDREVAADTERTFKSPEHLEQHRRCLFAEEDRRVRAIWRANLMSFLLLVAAVAVAFAAQALSLYPLTEKQLALSSGFVFAWAGLGRLGWQDGSFKGKTPVENVDRFFFRAQCFLGMYLAALAAM